MNNIKQLSDLALRQWINVTCQSLHWKIPRGEEWLDSLVKILELENLGGRWKHIFEQNNPLQNKFVKLLQTVYIDRRNTGSTIEVKRYWNRRLNQIEKSMGIVDIRSYPLHGVLEITQDCNLQCPMCTRSYEEVNRSDLPTNILDKLNPILPYMDEIELMGFGESLLSSNFFPILYSLPRIKGQTISIITNGLLLTPDRAEKIVDSPLKKINISLESMDKETYYSIRGYDGYDKVIENLQYLNKIKNQKKSDSPSIWFNYVMRRDNMCQLPDFIQWAEQWGIDGIQVLWFIAYTEDQWLNSLIVDRKGTNEVLDNAIQAAGRTKLKVHLPGKFNLDVSLSASQKLEYTGTCPVPWDMFYICNDLSLRPCFINQTYLGQLKDTDFESVWNGNLYQNYRKNTNSSHRQYQCRNCYYMNVRMDHMNCHLVNLKIHYDELDITDRLHLPENYSERLNMFMNKLIQGNFSS